MLSTEALGRLLAEVGPLIEAVSITGDADAGVYWIDFGASFEFGLDHDEARGVLVISAPLTAPKPESRAETLTLLMEVNGIWRENGGLRFGLDADGDIVMSVDLATEGLDANRLADALGVFGARAAKWFDVLSGIGSTAPEDAPADGGPVEIIRG